MKILFLDIDGVMKPGRSYFKDFNEKSNGDFDPLAVQCVNRICERSGAQIVFNSVWNRGTDDSILDIARWEGIGGSYIHTDFVTKYPQYAHDRFDGIEGWLIEHQGWTHWAALDDAPIDHENAIRVDPMNGISVENYRGAMTLLDADDPFVLMI